MIEWFMFGALGFFLGCLLALILAPPLWNRAVKLTTRRLEATMPMTLADIQADKDQLRAEFAIELRKVEVALDKAKEKAARELIEANKRRVEIGQLNADVAGIKSELQESQNANRVLQQTIKRRLPDLDARLKAAKKALTELETVNAELRNTVASQSEALKIARATVHNQRADIDRLRMSLESGSAAAMRGSGKGDARALAENQRLSAELSRVQEELDRSKISAQENAFLRRELSRLASQIMSAARNQAMSPLAMSAELPEPAEEYAEAPMEAHPESYGHAQETAVAHHAEQHHAEAPHGEETYAEEEYAEEDYAEEAYAEHAHAGNGAMPEPEMEHVSVEAAEAEYQEGVPGDDYAEEAEAEAEPEERGSLVKRFAARRAKRNAEKTGGGSLSSRLRRVVAERPETRG